jgi:hypothetical protein
MIRSVKVANFLYITAFFLACVRGLMEYYVGRQAAFVLQLAGILICLMLLLDFKYVARVLTSTRLGFFIQSIIAISVLSIVVTYFINGYYGQNYIILILFTVFLLLFSFSLHNNPNLLRPEFNYKAALIICFLLTLVALLQELRIEPIDFPGKTADFGLIRPQSLTGSFLHYPLIIAIIACITFVELIKKVTLVSLGIFVYFFLSLIFTLSRSGMFITFFVIIYYIIAKFNLRIAFFVLALALISIGLSVYFPTESAIISNRIFGSTSIRSEGNDYRFELWKIGVGMLSPLNLLSGTYFGLVTNSAPEEYSKGIVESGLLQQLLNIGFIATALYYSILWDIRKIIAPAYVIILIACLLQTFIYQSIEVIPFLFLVITLPAYTKRLT